MTQGSSTRASLTLRVAEADERDVGRGVARCDPQDMERLGVAPGDIVELAGKNRGVARVMPTHLEQRGRALVQMDGILRANASASLDEAVTVQAADARDASQVTLAPAGPGSAAFRDAERKYLSRLLSGRPVIQGDQVRLSPFGSQARDFMVVSTSPEGVVLISPDTLVRIQNEEVPGRSGGVSYEDIGGLHREVHRVREMVELPLKYPEVFDRLGIDPPRGVLLQGPPGCGKTLIARAVAHETQAFFIPVSGPEIVHKFYGESEKHLREIFETASRKAPSIVFLDEIDAIAPKREELGGEKQVERRVVAQLLALMDGLKSRGNVIVIGATNLPDILDPALRRPGRFDRELTLGIPDQQGRQEIIRVHTRGMPLAQTVDLERLAEVTHGFVGADLAALCREAAMSALRRVLPRLELSRGRVPDEELLALQVEMEDFVLALREVEPSGLREVSVEIPSVRWDQVGGLDAPKAALQEAVEWPLKHRGLVAHVGARAPRGILLGGAPGTGKTLLARAVACESGVNFIAVSGPSLISRYLGESERGVREVFRKARLAAPCVVFFDEIDGLFPRRGGGLESGAGDRVVSQFLAEFDGVTGLSGVVVLGATNRVERLDPALLRPGRFDLVLEMSLPDAGDRAEILRIHTRGKPLGQDVDLCALAGDPTAGLSGAELEGLVNRTAWLAVREFLAADGARTDFGSIRLSRRQFEESLAWQRQQKAERDKWTHR